MEHGIECNSDEMPLISIIIPVFNKENLIKQCIESALEQTYFNLQVIVIDDGSTDNSGVICDEYQDKGVTVIHSINKGVGGARNLGLMESKGEYICFVDSDDYLHKDFVLFLYRLLVTYSADIAACNSNYVQKNKIEKINKNIHIANKIECFSAIEAINSMWYEEKIKIAPWGKLFKKKLWNEIFFRENYVCEDYVTVYKVFLKTNQILYYDNKLYFYREEMNSQCNSFFEKKLEVIDIAKEIIDICNNEFPLILAAAINKGVALNFQIICQIPYVSGKYSTYYHQAKNFIKEYRMKVLKDRRGRRKTKIAIYMSYLSFLLVRVIYRYMLKRHKAINV